MADDNSGALWPAYEDVAAPGPGAATRRLLRVDVARSFDPSSYQSFLHVVCQMIHPAPGESHDQRGNAVSPRRGHETTGVGNEQVADIMGLAKRIEHARLLGPHPGRPHFVCGVPH